MLDIMTKAKDAIKAYNTALSVYSSNIANMSVTGYKRLDISFQSIFEKVLNGGSAANSFSGTGGVNPMQIGQGSAIGNVKLDFTQGTFSSAGYLDLAISGQGLFMVTPDDGQTMLYTRSGKFHFDTDGFLRTETGMKVYGTAAGGALEPINVPSVVNKNLLSWDADGVLTLYNEKFDDDGNPLGYPDLENPTGTVYHTIALTYFQNPGGLKQSQGTTFEQTLASGDAQSYYNPVPYGGVGPVGSVFPRQLEQSNVFYLEETINSLEVQRAMSGNLTIIRMASDIISQFINRLS
jgi:flagellar hook protein FlgE